ncbi:helix-turn-helix domain-containing protein [Streptomyces sp. NPDC059853]|uniref:helix-turn-helix domain-containing protein n=1 Tax=Streptomyces sp. NPDC059853 TaxID=3346973 RepID=UPI00365B4D2E
MELTDRGRRDARFGSRIRKLRTDRGLTLRALSEQLDGYAYSYLSRVERGIQPASRALVAALDAFYEAQGALSELHSLERDIQFARYSREYVRLERSARRIEVFTSSIIPGLLQTREYATDLFRTGLPAADREDVAAKVAARIERQAILDGEDPPYYWAVMDEAALMRPIAGAGMRPQLKRLLAACDRPRTEIQVLPWRQGLHPLLGGSLTLLTMSNGALWAHVESFSSGQTVSSDEDGEKVIEQRTRYDVARSMALSTRESAVLIRRYLEESE